MTNSLTQGQKLGVDQQLASDNGKVLLTMQGDGNLVLYRSSDRKALWASHTDRRPATYAMMQDDGNLVVYGNDGRAHWATGTSIHPGARCVLQDDGNLVVYTARGSAVWESHTVQDWNPRAAEAPRQPSASSAAEGRRPDGRVTLINLTGERWIRIGQHSYQMNQWDFPAAVEPDSEAPCYVEWDEGQFTYAADDCGEARYQFDRSGYQFEVRARNHEGHMISVVNLGLPQPLWRHRGDDQRLGWRENGAVSFTLPGRD